MWKYVHLRKQTKNKGSGRGNLPLSKQGKTEANSPRRQSWVRKGNRHTGNRKARKEAGEQVNGNAGKGGVTSGT